MKLRKCDCGYTLKERCDKCGVTKDGHYKFIRIKDVEETSKFRNK
jgi:hypothetical protein